jgi:3-dehydroquinate synthase
VVSDDFRETGRRAILNFGHTVGHAVETLSDLSHGESVAVGMVAAAAASSEDLGFGGAERIRATIESVGLPTRAPALDAEDVRAVMRLDKKRDDAGLRMVLLEDFGRPVLKPVGAATVGIALEAIGLE